MENNKTKIIMWSGGGTGGSVMPLLAVAEELSEELSGENQDFSWRFVFVGTKNGLEREMVANFNKDIARMEFISLISGKWRRYFSIYNFLDIFKIIAAWFQSLCLLARIRPDIIISAGAFVSVPLVWAAALRKIPILIHQQDLRPGLANKLMAPLARAITVVFEKSLVDYGSRAILTGNPIRRSVDINDEELIKSLKKEYSLDNSIPLVLVHGGGLGAAAVNGFIFESASELSRAYQIIHLTGKGKLPTEPGLLKMANYHVAEFIDNRTLSALTAMSDLVISRAGLGTLTELSYWRKPAILIPMPQSHQEDNAAYFAEARAALYLNQSELSSEKLIATIKDVLGNSSLKRELSNNIGKIMKRDAAGIISGIIWEIIVAKQNRKEI